MDNAEAEGADFVGMRVVNESPSMVALVRLRSITVTELTMATTKAKEDDDNDKKMTSTIPLPPLPTTMTTTATTATTTPVPLTAPNTLKDHPPSVQDPQSSGGDESIVSSAFFDSTEQSTGTLFLPLPNTSANKSQSSFVLSDDELPPEIANADISIASESAPLPFSVSYQRCPSKVSTHVRVSPSGGGKLRVLQYGRLACPLDPPAACTDPSPFSSGNGGYKFLSRTVTGVHLF